jgi:hypothetical protein
LLLEIVLGFLRSFDVEKDEHPVRFILENLKDGIYNSLYDWLENEVAGEDEALKTVHPDSVAVHAPCLTSRCRLCFTSAAVPRRKERVLTCFDQSCATTCNS